MVADNPSDDYYSLDPEFSDPKRIKKEREKAARLKKTQWWLNLLNRGICHYCEKKFDRKDLTMDHVVPIARGGSSTEGNIVPACRNCNAGKKLHTPVDLILKKNAQATWGSDQTQFFFSLTPDRVLEAVESAGLLCTGRCLTLNSFENRVYDVELELDDPILQKDPQASRRVVKFYRPGRWSEAQILEEHEFLADLKAAEIPAIAPLPFPNGKTLLQTRESGIWYAIFPKVGGRAPEEFTDEQLERVGRLLARIHNVGAAREAQHRMELTVSTYGFSNLEFLLKGGFLPVEIAGRYEKTVREIARLSEPLFAEVPFFRVHGDCHPGNLLWNQQGPFFLDFDDMIRGPAVQDIWLLIPGRDAQARAQREVLIEAYSEMRDFNRKSLHLIEPLRALRFVHYSAWIARRWEDPAFPAAFPEFGSHAYWESETRDLEDQLELIRAPG
jgi:Ser/Thr protein kinase RdoA (MazF antagonist)